MEKIQVGRSEHVVKDGKFDIALDLLEGSNIIPIEVGNGVVTSTMELKIERMGTSTLPGATAVTPETIAATPTKTVTPVKAPTVKTPPKKTSPTSAVAQVPVTFSSSEMQATVSLSSYGAQLTWSRAFTPFQSYVIVKSTTDPGVYFPKVFWIKAINNIDLTTWLDKSPASGKTYYRVCKLEPDQSVVCGNVTSVTK